MALRLGFHGGAGTVTGSKHLLSLADTSILIDCGLFQGLKELRLRNWSPPTFNPRRVSAVILTHAHIDHSGYIPRLIREGFRGPVFCTPATRDLAGILLLDAARLQEEDAAHANRKGYSKHRPALPLFDERDAVMALRHFETVPFEHWVDRGPFRFRFLPAGHILGSAFIEIEAHEGSVRTGTVFSGDLGRCDAPLHADPAPLPACDTLVLEATYGDREHDHSPLGDQLLNAVQPVLQRRGIVLIPAFAVARAQIVALELRKLMDSGRLPEVPIDVDSPMAADVTDVYSRYAGAEDLDAIRRQGTLFPRQIRFRDTPQESKALNDLPGPRIIISASGMLAGGRVLHHLSRLAGDRKNQILLVGFQAAGTRGRALQEGAKSIRLHGMDVPIAAEVVTLHGFSAHADADELAGWALSGPERPKTTFLVHAEPGAAREFARDLEARDLHPVVPWLGSEYEFIPSSRRWRQV